MINKYPGSCRRCWAHVPAGEGRAVHDGLLWEVEHTGECPPNPLAPPGTPTVTLSRGEGYGGTGWAPGQVLRETWPREANPDRLAFPGHRDAPGDRESGIVLVVAARAVYYRQEAMSFGVGDEQGHLYLARVVPATEQAAAPVLAAERVTARRDDLAARVRAAFYWGVPAGDAQRPPADQTGHLGALEPVPLGPPLRHRPLGSGPPDELLLDPDHDRAWTLTYNGGDGDDWSASNYRAYIALAHPLTEQRRALIDQLTAEYGHSTAAYVRAGIDPDHAAELVPVLREAGVTADRLARQRMSVTTVADVAALTSRTPDQWERAGWGRYAPYTGLTAADAARLADAGITADRACLLREAGFRTAETMLTAAPPAVPDDATRVIIRDRTCAWVTDDPAAARAWLDRNPQTWGRVHADTAPLRCVHAAGAPLLGSPHRPWQLWDDGSMTLGGWLRPPGHPPGEPYQAPRSLTAAAEHALTLALSSCNARQVWGEPGDRALRGRLTAITGRTSTTLDTRTRDDGPRAGRCWTLRRHDYDHPDGPVTIWQLLEEGWAMGEDGEHWSSYTTYRDEAAARAAFTAATA